ncbi:transposase [Roseibium salinum]|uniref:transposase n=1 Tax=Roseibium salinum TaxID=1604349 RepID=UPI0035E7AD8F
MMRTRFTGEQIIGILAEHEAGAKCADLCRKHGKPEGTFYNWKANCLLETEWTATDIPNARNATHKGPFGFRASGQIWPTSADI